MMQENGAASRDELAERPTLGRPAPAGPQSRRRRVLEQRVDTHLGPGEAPPLRLPSPSATCAVKVRSAERSTWVSTTTRPPSRTISAQRASSATGSPPMPMLPSITSAVSHRPPSGIGSKADPCTAVPPERRAIATASTDTSTPSAGMPRACAATRIRPGPQPMSMTGPSAGQQIRSSAGDSSRGEHRRSKMVRCTGCPEVRTQRNSPVLGPDKLPARDDQWMTKTSTVR